MSNTPDLSQVEWVKSSHSGNGGDTCVEFSRTLAASDVIPVRDSKNPEGPALTFEVGAWSLFIANVKRTTDGV
ncbi:DUF397 domain-containing protein [Streptomyces sp. AV19]|uniref:DUF397 domain-containing protein n=1 Tax=Streptomyces sp. AV19 TaxID=2793068 RepID=UPI0018FE1254|nr:DUF397 domain-containing protein [Streptomyces sp. AV19]MBH1935770.1 DUF397 domain-containing protein [Streptomyces sp. AV19]MDG4535956.1 DUF397 domain-containing protein [Streptomyces sp. AV19]